jgi:hypothetical protein
VLGILATLAANVAAGAHFGIIGGLINAWPAIAFIMASEILLRKLRAARDLPSPDAAAGTVAAAAPTAPASTLATVADAVPRETAGNGPSVPESTPMNVSDPVPPIVPLVTPVTPGKARSGTPTPPEAADP